MRQIWAPVSTLSLNKEKLSNIRVFLGKLETIYRNCQIWAPVSTSLNKKKLSNIRVFLGKLEAIYRNSRQWWCEQDSHKLHWSRGHKNAEGSPSLIFQIEFTKK